MERTKRSAYVLGLKNLYFQTMQRLSNSKKRKGGLRAIGLIIFVRIYVGKISHRYAKGVEGRNARKEERGCK